MQIGNNSSDLSRRLESLRCEFVRIGNSFRGLTVGFSRTALQPTSGAVGKTRDPKAASGSLYNAGHIGTVVGTYGNVHVVPPLLFALDGREVQTHLVEPRVRLPR